MGARAGPCAGIVAIAWVAAAPTLSAATPSIAPDELEHRAAELASLLEARAAILPDGSRASVLSLVGRDRLEPSLAAVSEAEAWPAAWLVIQDAGRPLDLLLPLRLAGDGSLDVPDTPVAAARREWDHASVVSAYRAAAGRKPRQKVVNLVLHSFRTTTVESYVYEPAAAGSTEGLMALLPPGSLLREAREADIGDGRRHTLALVLQDAAFVPSDCSSCEERMLGHADTGRFLLVLAGERELDSTLDLTPHLAGIDGRPLLPRHACADGDGPPTVRGRALIERFRDRPKVELLELRDLDGDGRALELDLPGAIGDCETRQRLVVAIEPETTTLRIVR